MRADITRRLRFKCSPELSHHDWLGGGGHMRLNRSCSISFLALAILLPPMAVACSRHKTSEAFFVLLEGCGCPPLFLGGAVVGMAIAGLSGRLRWSPVVAGGFGGLIGGWLGVLSVVWLTDSGIVWAMLYLGAVVGSVTLCILFARRDRRTIPPIPQA